MESIPSKSFEQLLKQAHTGTAPSKQLKTLAGKYMVLGDLDLRNLDWLREIPKVAVQSAACLSYSKGLTVAHINAGSAIYATSSGLRGFAPGSSSGSDSLGVGLDIEFCEHFGELLFTTSGGVDASWSGITGVSAKSSTGVTVIGMALKASGCKNLRNLNVAFPGAVDISGTKDVVLGDNFSALPDQSGVCLYLSAIPENIPSAMGSAVVRVGKRNIVLQNELASTEHASGLDIF